MALNKRLKRSDKVANLYRAAYHLARGSKTIALDFLRKSGLKFDDFGTETEKQRLFWAEKILDKYIELKTVSR